MIIIKSNVVTLQDVLIPDLGIFIPSGGGQEEFTSVNDITKIKSSYDVLRLATDGIHTLILNDGTNDIPSGDVESFLSSATSLQDYPDIWSMTEGYVYVGRRQGEALVTDPLWQIYRYTPNTPNSIMYADGDEDYDNVWANRSTLSYAPV